MEISLNIYKGRNVEKTYKAEDFTLMTGTCEDIMKAIDIDKLMSGTMSEEQMGIEIIKIVARSFSMFLPFLQEVFEGLTEEEYRRTSIKEVGKCIIAIVTYTVNELFNVGDSSKN